MVKTPLQVVFEEDQAQPEAERQYKNKEDFFSSSIDPASNTSGVVVDTKAKTMKSVRAKKENEMDVDISLPIEIPKPIKRHKKSAPDASSPIADAKQNKTKTESLEKVPNKNKANTHKTNADKLEESIENNLRKIQKQVKKENAVKASKLTTYLAFAFMLLGLSLVGFAISKGF